MEAGAMCGGWILACLNVNKKGRLLAAPALLHRLNVLLIKGQDRTEDGKRTFK
jgi:hypothetical protein